MTDVQEYVDGLIDVAGDYPSVSQFLKEAATMLSHERLRAEKAEADIAHMLVSHNRLLSRAIAAERQLATIDEAVATMRNGLIRADVLKAAIDRHASRTSPSNAP